MPPPARPARNAGGFADTGELGDLVVVLKVKVPKSLSPRQRELLQEYAEEERAKKSGGGSKGGSGGANKGEAPREQQQGGRGWA